MTSGEPASKDLHVVPLGNRWAEWNRFVERSSQSTFAHRGEWAHLIERLFRQKHEYLVAEDSSGTWRGILPLVHLRGVLGHFLLSMPFLNDGGPIGDEVAREQLAKAAIALARASRAKSVELRSREPVPGTDSAGGHKVGVRLSLPATVEELWEKTFKAKLRSQIRRPTKEGMTTHVGADQLEAFHAVFCHNMRDLGTPALPRRFFALLQDEFGNDVVFVSVRAKSGRPAAAACCLVWRKEIEVVWASSLREFNPLSPNMLLYATLMEHAIARGATLFNFGRSTPGAPTHRFKQQWGGNDVQLPWLIWPDRGNAGGSERSRVLGAAISVWRRLPLPIANRLGPMIAGQLPW